VKGEKARKNKEFQKAAKEKKTIEKTKLAWRKQGTKPSLKVSG